MVPKGPPVRTAFGSHGVQAMAATGNETRLVATAKQTSLAELRAECARAKAAVCADLEARRRRIHARRGLRQWADADGVWHLQLRHNPEVGAQFMAALEPLRDRIFHQARAEGRREAPEAHAADALVAAVCGPPQAAPPARAGVKVIVRVDLAALLGGYPIEGETCEIAGFGPVAVSAVGDLIDTGDPLLAAVVTRGEAVVGWPIRDAVPGPPRARRWSGCIPAVPPRAVPPPPSWRSTTAWGGRRATSPWWTCSTGCVPIITTARPSTAGLWWTAGASGPSSPPTIPDIPATRTVRTTHPLRVITKGSQSRWLSAVAPARARREDTAS